MTPNSNQGAMVTLKLQGNKNALGHNENLCTYYVNMVLGVVKTEILLQVQTICNLCICCEYHHFSNVIFNSFLDFFFRRFQRFFFFSIAFFFSLNLLCKNTSAASEEYSLESFLSISSFISQNFLLKCYSFDTFFYDIIYVKPIFL